MQIESFIFGMLFGALALAVFLAAIRIIESRSCNLHIRGYLPEIDDDLLPPMPPKRGSGVTDFARRSKPKTKAPTGRKAF